jgi:GT2 family glycosyltransferase
MIDNSFVSIIIPVKDCYNYFRNCIRSVIKYTKDCNYELIIIDNASGPQVKSYIRQLLRSFNFIKVITNSKNKGFAYAINQGIQIASGEYICLLNSDTFVTPNWLTKLLKGFKMPNAGIVGPTTTYCSTSQGLYKNSSDKFTELTIEQAISLSSKLKDKCIEIIDLQGFCYLIAKEVINKIGVFDWKSFPIGGAEEIDFNIRARKAGFKLYHVVNSFVHHYRHATFIESNIDKKKITEANLQILRKKSYEDLYIPNDIDNIIQTKSELIDVVMPILDRPKETVATLRSLFKNNQNINVIVVDNGSDDLSYLTEFNVHIIKNDKNLGVTKALNQGLTISKSKYIILMHNDIVINTDNWIDKAITFMEKNESVGIVGIAGFKRLLQSANVTNIVSGIKKYDKELFKKAQTDFIEVQALDGCCMILKNIELKLDENLNYYFYDWDLSLQYCKKGYKLYAMNSTSEHFADDRKRATFNNPKYKNSCPNDEAYLKQSKEYFIKKWNDFIPEEVIVTANINSVDNPIKKHFDNPEFKYIIFTDDKNIKSDFWNINYIKPKFNDPRREARMYKWLIHKFFPDIKYSLWVDSNIIIMSEITALIRLYLADSDIALIRHWRDCIYEEGKICMDEYLDKPDIIKKQLERYKAENYPEHNGLHQTRVILRRHTKEINALNEAVWSEICTGSLRDQLCFNYMAWKMGINVNDIPGKFIIYSSIDKVNIEHPYNFGLINHTKQNRFYK